MVDSDEISHIAKKILEREELQADDRTVFHITNLALASDREAIDAFRQKIGFDAKLDLFCRSVGIETPKPKPRTFPNNKKWEWNEGDLINRTSGRSFNSHQAMWDSDMKCFEFTDDMPHVRTYEAEVDFLKPQNRCIRCARPLTSADAVIKVCSVCARGR